MFYRTNGIKQNDSLHHSEREDVVDAQNNKTEEDLTKRAVHLHLSIRIFVQKHSNFKKTVFI